MRKNRYKCVMEKEWDYSICLSSCGEIPLSLTVGHQEESYDSNETYNVSRLFSMVSSLYFYSIQRLMETMKWNKSGRNWCKRHFGSRIVPATKMAAFPSRLSLVNPSAFANTRNMKFLFALMNWLVTAHCTAMKR